jgi:hypothetical protein
MRTPPPDAFPFVKVVAAQMYGTALVRESFMVPVTIGALPALTYDFGLIGFIAFGLIGALYASLERLAMRGLSPVGLAGGSTALVALTDYATKGDLLFDVLNWSAMFVFALILFRGASAVHGAVMRRVRAARLV